MIKIINLCDNKSCLSEYKAEHGLSYYLEIENKKFLFDTGASNIFINNAEKLNVDLKELDGIILSHGHYDHTGGLNYLKNKKAYCHSNLFILKYKKNKTDKYDYIGNPYNQSFYEKNHQLNFIFVDKLKTIIPNVNFIYNFTKTKHDNYFYIKPLNKDEYLEDTFDDELAITINTQRGLIIITGCAHSGIINIIDKSILQTNQNKIYALLGGFHLSNISDQKLENIANKLNKYKIENIGISHCTGDKLNNYLIYGNVFNFNVGDILNV